ncbi:MAG: hypothetical protein JRI68_02000 [Deltaproteobacteria bacterium]|nr:hypothetical protein [Deltaproteobacteria bacterium]
MLRVPLALLIAAATVLAPSLAFADVIGPPPTDCPKGHEATSDHGGAYCRPAKPGNCPPSHRPMVVRDKAYCQPPPSKSCPKGTFWTSESATDTFCMAAARCDSSSCRKGMECMDTALCVTMRPLGRGLAEVVTGTCPDGSCAQGKCLKSKRCHASIVQTDSSATPDSSAAPDPSASGSAEPEPSAAASAEAAPSAEPAASGSAAPRVPVAPPAPPAPPASGCGCVVGGSAPTGSLAAVMGLLALALAGLSRRRA